MRSSNPARPSARPPRRRASIVPLLALLALAAGVQALAPASAGAVANQLTDCTPNGVPGWGFDTAGNWCETGGGEVIEVDEGPCVPRWSCLPREQAGDGGGSGSGSGSGEAPATRPAGKPVKGTKKPNPRECLELGEVGMVWSPTWLRQAAMEAQLTDPKNKATLDRLKALDDQLIKLLIKYPTPATRKAEFLRKYNAVLDQMDVLQDRLNPIDKAKRDWDRGKCSKTLYDV